MGISPLRKKFYGASLIYENNFYGAPLILRKYYGALLTSSDKLWGISQNQKIEKCDPPPYHVLLMTAPLCEKMEFYGFRGNTNKLIQSYLNNRKQFVSLNGFDSEIRNITCGVPRVHQWDHYSS